VSKQENQPPSIVLGRDSKRGKKEEILYSKSGEWVRLWVLLIGSCPGSARGGLIRNPGFSSM
jgi:hypothetical protein